MSNRAKTRSKNRNTLRYVSRTATCLSYFYGLQIRRTSGFVDVFEVLSAYAFPHPTLDTCRAPFLFTVISLKGREEFLIQLSRLSSVAWAG